MDTIASLPQSPPEWSLEVGYLGRFAIFFAILFFAFAAIGWLLQPKHEFLKKYAARSFTFGCVSLFTAFVSLAILFVNTRLEFTYVYDHGDATNSIPYRIAGIWAGQQGSFLLWACCSALFGILAVRGTGILRRWFTISYAGFLFSLACILAYESPFGMYLLDGRPFVPASGQGLTPALQNYWVTIHPPTIFMGFGSLTVLAAYAFSALATNKPTLWAPMVRPWALVSMAVTGVGLCMGGFWAYETLGWGGFWAWDPVENVSFVPWIFSAALVHGLMVQIAKRGWTITNLLLGGLPFLLFVYGTFLTRSGVLNETSVHSFANMDHSALKLLLGFMGISSITFLSLWGWRAMQYRKEYATPPPPPGIHREGLFRIGAWLLAGLGLGAAIGMSWPMIMALGGQKPKVVEAGLYHHTLTWLYIPLMIVMGLGPLVAWRGMGLGQLLNRLFGIVCVTVAGIGITMIVIGRNAWTQAIPPDDKVAMPFGAHMGIRPWIVILATLSIFVIVANLWRVSELIRRSKMSAAAFLAHVGVATLMAGLIISQGFEQKKEIMVQEGGHAEGLGYFVTYKGMTSNDQMDRNNKVLFDVDNGKEHWTASPGLYYVDGGDDGPRPMVWPHIQAHPLYDIYFALQPPTNELGTAVSLKPGETKAINGVMVTYERLTREGQPGQAGTKWGALVKISNGTDSVEVNPKMQIGGAGGPSDLPAAIDDNTLLSMQGMNAGDKSVSLQMLSAKPFYPVTMFFKPMTILVWGGTGILGFSGLLSAFYRRVRVPKTAPAGDEKAAAGTNPNPGKRAQPARA
ncbi:MAG TPA: cytochrome c biogenesis protein CcsA [Fimbriimonadaceae bacterium]|nr:cytochrome c biogenesis protein CcsA [Fimbriimonadaceae bacterium]